MHKIAQDVHLLLSYCSGLYDIWQHMQLTRAVKKNIHLSLPNDCVAGKLFIWKTEEIADVITELYSSALIQC